MITKRRGQGEQCTVKGGRVLLHTTSIVFDSLFGHDNVIVEVAVTHADPSVSGLVRGTALVTVLVRGRPPFSGTLSYESRAVDETVVLTAAMSLVVKATWDLVFGELAIAKSKLKN